MSARVALSLFIAEYDSIYALQTCMKGFQVSVTECVVSEIDGVVSSTGNFNIIKNLQKHITAVSRVNLAPRGVRCRTLRQDNTNELGACLRV